MNKYLEPPKVTFEKVYKPEPYRYIGDVDKCREFSIAMQRDKTIEKILLDMGITEDFRIAHKEDFQLTDIDAGLEFSYKDKVLFTETALIDDKNYTYRYEIYQKGKVV